MTFWASFLASCPFSRARGPLMRVPGGCDKGARGARSELRPTVSRLRRASDSAQLVLYVQNIQTYSDNVGKSSWHSTQRHEYTAKQLCKTNSYHQARLTLGLHLSSDGLPNSFCNVHIRSHNTLKQQQVKDSFKYDTWIYGHSQGEGVRGLD